MPEWRFLVDPDGLIDFFSGITNNWSPYNFHVRLERLMMMLNAVSDDSALSKLLSKSSRLLGGGNIKPYYGLRAVEHAPSFQQLAAELKNKLIEFQFTGAWTGEPAGLSGGHKINYSSPPDKNALAEIIRNFLSAVANDVLQHKNKSILIEKNTWNILFFDKIMDILPDARLVHIFRDPRDVVASFCQQSWMPDKPEDAAVIYRDLMEEWFKVKARVPAESVRELPLENLCSEPEDNLRKICDFWNIEWHDSLLSVKLDKMHGGRWRSDFNDKTRERVEDTVRPIMEHYGYQ